RGLDPVQRRERAPGEGRLSAPQTMMERVGRALVTEAGTDRTHRGGGGGGDLTFLGTKLESCRDAGRALGPLACKGNDEILALRGIALEADATGLGQGIDQPGLSHFESNGGGTGAERPAARAGSTVAAGGQPQDREDRRNATREWHQLGLGKRTGG